MDARKIRKTVILKIEPPGPIGILFKIIRQKKPLTDLELKKIEKILKTPATEYITARGHTIAIYKKLNSKLYSPVFENPKEININAIDESGKTLLHWAIRNNHIPVIKLLLSETNINFDKKFGRMTPLLLATIQKNFPVVKLLLDAKANPNLRDDKKRSALMSAICLSDLGIVDALLDAKAKPNLKDHQGNTALHWTIRNIHQDKNKVVIVRKLIATNAKLNKKNDEGDTPLVLACQFGRAEIARELIKAKADLEMVNDENNTPLNIATAREHQNIAHFLIAAKANIEMQNNYGQTALIFAAFKGLSSLACKLMEAKADFEKRTTAGNTALILASSFNHQEIMQQLVKAKADPDVKGHDGHTALIDAAYHGHDEIIEYLIKKAHANVETTNDNKQTALDIAIANRHLVSVERLLEHQAIIRQPKNLLDYLKSCDASRPALFQALTLFYQQTLLVGNDLGVLYQVENYLKQLNLLRAAHYPKLCDTLKRKTSLNKKTCSIIADYTLFSDKRFKLAEMKEMLEKKDEVRVLSIDVDNKPCCSIL